MFNHNQIDNESKNLSNTRTANYKKICHTERHQIKTSPEAKHRQHAHAYKYPVLFKPLVTVYQLFALYAGTYTPKIKFGEIKKIYAFS